MKQRSWLTAGLGCTLCIGAAGALRAQQYNPPPPQPGYGQQQPNGNYGPPPQGQNYGPPPQGQGYGPPPQGPGGWDAPPPEFSPIQQQGFRDGMRAAREDFRSGRGFAVTRNPYYRHPPAPREQRDLYRDAFQRGYDRVMRHRADALPPPPPG